MSDKENEGIDPTKGYTPSQASVFYNVDPRTVGRWIKDGRLGGQRTLGGHSRILGKDIIASGVCRNCSTLKNPNDGSCLC